MQYCSIQVRAEIRIETQKRHAYLIPCVICDVPVFNINPQSAGNLINLVQTSQYHGCWCPGSLCCQDISTHDIDYIE